MLPKLLVSAIGYALFLAAAICFLGPLVLYARIRGYL